MSDQKIDLKPTIRIMELCDDMFHRKANSGQDYPSEWKFKTRVKAEALGLVERKGKHFMYGNLYYFTEAGLAWYLVQRPQHNRHPAITI